MEAEGPLGVAALRRRVFDDAYDRIKREKTLEAGDADRLLRLFGDRFTKALQALDDGRVRKHVFSPSGRVVWTVVGEEREYQILPLATFCSCNDFYFRVLSHDAFLCYHLLAQKLADALDRYVLVAEGDGGYSTLLAALRTSAVETRQFLPEEAETVRRLVASLLETEERASARQLLTNIQGFGFEVLTPRHLAAILVADKKKRFTCTKGLWTLHATDGGKG
jgi:predicted nucleic acid-binding Zn finger protein